MKSSSDVWFCAYLLLNGYKVEKYDVISHGKVRCYFDLANDDWQRHKVEFSNSEIIRYKSTIDVIKDMAF